MYSGSRRGEMRSREMKSHHDRPLDTSIDVVTPENIAFEYQLAGIARRSVAFVLDFGLRLAVWLILLVTAALTSIFEIFDPSLVMAILLLLLFVSEWFYGAILEAYWNGQTIGKRMQGIRVVQVNGQPINGLQAVLRNVLRVADMMPALPLGELLGSLFDEELPGLTMPTFLICVVATMMNPRLQRLGDLVSGTMVVIDAPLRSHALQQINEQSILTLAATLPHDMRLTRQQARAISSYVARRKGFPHDRQLELTRGLARALANQWQLPPPPDSDIFLCAVYHQVFIADSESVRAELPVTAEAVLSQ